MVRFVHTADLQLGKPFRRFGDRGDELRRRREEAVSKLAGVAAEKEVDFVVVAGDFFDANTVPDRVVARACQRLGEFEVPVYLLPGNHDASGGPDSVYRRDKFGRQVPEHVKVLDEAVAQPVAGGEAVLLPAPLQFRHSRRDPTEHLTGDFGREEAGDGVRIGVAHGGVIDFDSGSGHNVIDPRRAQRAELDYLALGDWHGCKKINERTWYSGTPEPDSFQDNEPGHCLVVDIEASGASAQVEQVETAQTDWIAHSVTLQERSDLNRLERWFEDLARPLETMVKLEYRGTLSFEDLARFKDQVLDDAGDRLLWMEARDEGLVARASEQELEEMTAEGFVGETVERLREMMDGDPERAATAGRSLQVLYRMMKTRGQ